MDATIKFFLNVRFHRLFLIQYRFVCYFAFIHFMPEYTVSDPTWNCGNICFENGMTRCIPNSYRNYK